MLRCECRARLGRGWRFCEACGRPVPAEAPGVAPERDTDPVVAAGLPETTAPVPVPPAPVSPPLTQTTVVPAPQVLTKPRQPATVLMRFDWRFGVLPVIMGGILGLPLLWLTLWCAPLGLICGALWAWRRHRMIRESMRSFTLEWIYEKVEVYGPCALGVRAWWPTGVLYLTDQTLKFKPFGHTKECEVSLDPARITGVDFPTHFTWPADWACMLVTSSYGPVFGTMKVFDRIHWGQLLQAARQKTTAVQLGEVE